MAHKIPFGYEIINGHACINRKEAEQLRQFFTLFLEGVSLREAGVKANLPFAKTAFPRILLRKEYTGTDYYPPIITSEYQAQLINEWNRRNAENPAYGKSRRKKGLKIHTKFTFQHGGQIVSGSPLEITKGLYEQITPVNE